MTLDFVFHARNIDLLQIPAQLSLTTMRIQRHLQSNPLCRILLDFHDFFFLLSLFLCTLGNFSKQLTSPKYLGFLSLISLVYTRNILSDYKSMYSQQLWEHIFSLLEKHAMQVVSKKGVCLPCGGLQNTGNVKYGWSQPVCEWMAFQKYLLSTHLWAGYFYWPSSSSIQV